MDGKTRRNWRKAAGNGEILIKVGVDSALEAEMQASRRIDQTFLRLHNSKSHYCNAAKVNRGRASALDRSRVGFGYKQPGMVVLGIGVTRPLRQVVSAPGVWLVRSYVAAARRPGFFALARAPSDTRARAWLRQERCSRRLELLHCAHYPCNLTNRSSRRCFVAAAACMRYASTRCRHYRSAA